MKQILSVGQCAADHTRITQWLTAEFEVQIDTADDHTTAVQKIEDTNFDLVLINRVLDQTGSAGMDIIRELKASDSLPPTMVVSNYEETQVQAVAAGAVRGFGKAALNAQTIEQLQPYLSQ